MMDEGAAIALSTEMTSGIPAYRRAYERGWRSGQRGAKLEGADRRGEPDAWYDGFHDHAAGRPKWHLATCRAPSGIHDGTAGCTLC